MLGGNGFSFCILRHRRIVYSIGFLPNFGSVFSDQLLQDFYRHFGKRLNFSHTDPRQQLESGIPTIGIFRTDNGLRKGCTRSSLISSCPTGLASPVPILDTVLFPERAKLMGSPVFFITERAISRVHW